MELCIQAVLADMKDANANTNDVYAMAEVKKEYLVFFYKIKVSTLAQG